MTKFYTNNTLLGRAGVNLIERVVTQMGWVWNATTIEAGIDGIIEIRDVASGRGTNLIIQVQSKARTTFQRETDDFVEFTCDERDLHYWLGGNAPVVLIVSRPESGEAYWLDLKAHFKDASTKRRRIARFDKQRDRFDINARERLQALAVPKDSGVYLGAPPKTEPLYSNLVSLSALAPALYTASTSLRDARAVRANLGWSSPDEWITRSGRIVSFCPLDDPVWSSIVDDGTIEQHQTGEWSAAGNPDRVNEFRELLNRTLRSLLRPLGISYFRPSEYFFFAAPTDLLARRIRYRSVRKSATRTVFQAFVKKESGQVSYYRHAAFSGQFLRLEGQWYLAIVPTYHFTADGWRQLRWYESKLQGIKRLERNSAVLGQVAMWAAILGGDADGLFTGKPYVKFGSLLKSELAAGINEAWWLWNEEDDTTRQAAADEPPTLPFTDETELA